jgi:hypothetical protein
MEQPLHVTFGEIEYHVLQMTILIMDQIDTCQIFETFESSHSIFGRPTHA